MAITGHSGIESDNAKLGVGSASDCDSGVITQQGMQSLIAPGGKAWQVGIDDEGDGSIETRREQGGAISDLLQLPLVTQRLVAIPNDVVSGGDGKFGLHRSRRAVSRARKTGLRR